MEQDRILVNLVVHRRFASMSPIFQKIYLALRELIRVAVASAIILALASKLPAGLTAGLTLGVIWLLASPWLQKQSPGTTRILLTKEGIFYMQEGFFCGWEDVGFHAHMGDRLTFEPAAGALPQKLFRKQRHVIPLGPLTRKRVLDLFQTRAGKGAS